MIAETTDPSKYVLSAETLSKPEPYGLMIRHDDQEFKSTVDAILKQVFTSPEMETLYAKWFTSPIPPKGMNLNLPMSPALRETFSNPKDYQE